MGFTTGAVSFRRFAVTGKQPDSIDQDLLDKLSEHALRPGELGVPEEMEYGWSGGRHVLDGNFSFENNVFADALHFALRIDTNRAPGELKRAYTMMEEEAAAAGNPSGFISKNQKRDVKDSVGRKMDEELRSGRFRRSKLVPVLWDIAGETLYCAASGKALEALMELFERTFGLTLEPLSAGTQAMRILQPQGKRRDYEDLRPTRFVRGPEGDSQFPEYPWVSKGAEPKDFLGNEFLLWLWHETETGDGLIDIPAGGATVMFDRFLELDCAYGISGKDSLRGTGPQRMPEARDALRSGKVPRRAGLTLDASGSPFSLGLNPELLQITGGKLPDIEDAASPRVVFEERIALLRDLAKLIDGTYEQFLSIRTSGSWEHEVANIRRWITQTSAKPAPAMVG